MLWAMWLILGDNYSFSAQAQHLCSPFREDGVKEAEKQLFVKKLLKFVLFMKVCWKLWKWRIKLFKKIVLKELLSAENSSEMVDY